MGSGRVSFPDTDAGSFSDTIIDSSMSDTETAAIQFENDRRALARRVKAAMAGIPYSSVPLTLLPQTANVPSNYREPTFNPSLNNFETYRIKQFLFQNRTALALETLDFEIPKHVPYDYVVSAGFSSLRPTDWRAFLIRCNKRVLPVLVSWKTLFLVEQILIHNRRREINCAPAATIGYVTKIAKNWPTDVLPPRQVLKATPEVIEIFDKGMQQVFRRGTGIFNKGIRDFDKLIILELMNCLLSKADSSSPKLSMDEFDGCLAHWESQKLFFG